MGAPWDLHSRHQETVHAWTRFVQRDTVPADLVRPEILSSWQRSAETIDADRVHDVDAAPMADESDTAAYWQDSPLHRAVGQVERELRETAEDGDLVIAVTDDESRILWTYGGRVMRRKAEAVNFVAGGRWDEPSIGTNALNLALRTDAPAMVFSAEHYAPLVHHWVCWAAPSTTPAPVLSWAWSTSPPPGTARIRSAWPRPVSWPG